MLDRDLQTDFSCRGRRDSSFPGRNEAVKPQSATSLSESEVVTPSLGHRAIGWALAATTTVLRASPDWLAYAFADALVPILVLVTWMTRKKSTRKRRGFYHNTRVVYREGLRPAARRRLLWRWARHVTHLGVDTCKMPSITTANMHEFCDLEDMRVVERCMAAGKGIVGVTAHVGVYEYSSHLFCLNGIPMTSIYRKSPIVPVTDVINRIRASGGQKLTAREGALREMFRAIRAKEAVGIVADVSSKESEVFVPFLGTNAATNSSAGLLALRTGAPILIATTHRVRRRKYRFHVWDEFFVEPGGDRDADLRSIARRINDALSRAVRTYPEQWFWDSRRFRNRPDGEVIGPDGLPPQVAPEQAPTLG